MIAYAAIMLCAVATAWLISRRTQRRLPVARREQLAIGLGAFCGAMIGAKLPFVLTDWPGLVSGTAWFSDGKTIMCGLVGGYFGVEVAKWSVGVRIKTGDSFSVPVATAVAIGRLACFQAGCCYGQACSWPWAVNFGDGILRHPTQLYEAAFHALAALGLWKLQEHQYFRGQLIKLYIIAYMIYRFFSEWLRPEPQILLGLTGYQWAAIAVSLLFAWLWRRDAKMFAHQATSGIARTISLSGAQG